ncbi:MAG: hypothetical protein ACYSWO_05865 [Planctomycetota bacterium]
MRTCSPVSIQPTEFPIKVTLAGILSIIIWFFYVDIRELKHCCKAVYGGVSWPGIRPGFAVVAAMDRARHLDSHDVCLLDEFESYDVRELVRQCGVLHFKYRPDQWIGDWRNDAASRFIREMNEEAEHKREFSLCWTAMLDMEQLYQYVLAEIRSLLAPDRRQLFLKDSKIPGYLSEIEGSEVGELERGAYPAIEALAFAVVEMRRAAKAEYEDRFYQPVDDDPPLLSFEGLGL